MAEVVSSISKFPSGVGGRREGNYKRLRTPSPPPYRVPNHPRLYGDYLAVCNRWVGSRPGFPEERHHRSMGRSSGVYQATEGFDSGRGGGQTDTLTSGSTRREGLMSYKQFMQELEDDVLPSEAESRYQEYESEYISRQKKAFFETQKDKKWLKDRYHPTNLVAGIERRNDFARKQAKDFQLDLRSDVLDIGPSDIASSSNKYGQPNDLGSENRDGRNRRKHGSGSSEEADLVSEAPKAHPVSSESRRIQIDVEQALALVRKLDNEKGIEDNILCRNDNHRARRRDKSFRGASSSSAIIIYGLTSVKGLEGIELLDVLLTYLWRIHGLDYYGMTETNKARGLRHVRADETNSDAMVNGAEWEQKLDNFWKKRLKGQDPLEIMAAKEKIDAAANEGLDPYVRKIRDEKYGWKYGCRAKGCTKLFCAAEFVHKHLKLKHIDLVMELTSKVRDELYFHNYMSDENAPGGRQIRQQLTSKEKLHKRGLGLDNIVKDERGRREHGNKSNCAEGFDGSKNLQLRDDNANKAMFDSYGGKEIPMASFPFDIPQPERMAVPGAGLLGHFVPALPGFAMRMLREQGGPSPVEGRNIVSGPQLSRPAPRIAVPPAFYEDPRKLRSYEDLDSPEDEVDVIHYRNMPW